MISDYDHNTIIGWCETETYEVPQEAWNIFATYHLPDCHVVSLVYLRDRVRQSIGEVRDGRMTMRRAIMSAMYSYEEEQV